jgi:protein phosphatase
MHGKMDCYGLTDVGKVRDVNEDQFLIAELSKSLLIHQTSLSHEDHSRLFGGSQGHLLLVADGMGGHAAGKQASSIAVDSLAHYVLNTMSWFLRLREGREDDLLGELEAALRECQARVAAASSASPEHRGMGTTLTMAYLLWPRLYVVHAGDSRCYLLRGSRLRQITTDHTMARRLVDRGVLEPGGAEESRWSHVLWNCIGGGSQDLSVEVHKATLHLGDTLLLCTDGLTKSIGDEQIGAVLRQGQGAEPTCRRLVALANEQGGVDNITVVVARFLDPDQQVAQAHEHASAREGAGKTGNGVRTAPAADVVEGTVSIGV